MVEVADITRLLGEAQAGRDGALDELMRVVYRDLECAAAAQLRDRFGPRAMHVTLEPAALVNESFMKLIRHRYKYDSRGHFFAIATKVMLNVLIDYCRRQNAAKRGGDRTRISFSVAANQVHQPDDGKLHVQIEPLAKALQTLEELDSRKADVVKMRVVWGMSNDEIAVALDVSRPTVERDWRFAKAWLAEQVGTASEPTA